MPTVRIDGVGGWAVFGPGGDDDPHRYLLGRHLYEPMFREDNTRVLGAVLCNPSTATHEKSDPTITRMVGFARAWGYGVLELANIFALRSTDPKVLYSHPDPVGPENNAAIVHLARRAEVVLCAWGTHGAHLRRGDEVLELIRRAGAKPVALKLTKDGFPQHPLYLKANSQPFEIQ